MVRWDNDAALSKSSPLASLVLRISQNPTRWDNILDGSDCHSVRLPVVITLNGEEMTIENETDLDAVAQNMDYSWTDDDIVHFHFPIAIVQPNFVQQTVTTQAELDAMTCNDGQFNEITCLDFVFPVAINRYDVNNQVANTFTFYSDADLYHFIDGMAANEIFTVSYPLSVSFAGGNEVTVGSNTELESAIEQAIANCENAGPATLDEIMLSGSWYISYCEDDSSGSGSGNWVDIYYGYAFTFNANGSVTAIKNGVVSDGTWSTYQDSHQMLDLFFPTPALQGLTNNEWRVTEYNAANFRLKNDQSGSEGGHKYLYFTKL